MNISLYNQETAHGVLQMEIEKADYIEQVERGLRNIRMTASVAGFRKGMAPMGIIKSMYGKQVLVDELNKIVSDSLKTYFDEHPEIKLICPVLSNDNSNIRNMDSENQETFTFLFDLPISPPIDITLDKGDVLPYMRILPEDEWVEAKLDQYRIKSGGYDIVSDTVSEQSLVEGVMIELEKGEPKEGGIRVEKAMILPMYLQNTEEKSKFIGAEKGSVIVFNPRKAYEGATSVDAEVAALLAKAKQEIENLDSDFSFEITLIKIFQKAPLEQPFFDNMLGAGVVSGEEEFMTEFRKQLASMFVYESDAHFFPILYSYLMKKAGELPIAEDLIRRVIAEEDEKLTEEEIEASLPTTIASIRFRLIVGHILEQNNSDITNYDLNQKAFQEAARYLSNYGVYNPDPSWIEAQAADMLKNSKINLRLSAAAREEKLLTLAKELVTLDVKEISVREFNELTKAATAESTALPA
ncbi:MAG: trigger factor family protein [Tannerellaceae bacterium]|jgi:trigger factor|nr:trigger factor family protein [Tannerellaceae bacterium]